ncbi:MAG: hypothetical protein CMJ53_08475 [Planctomycetaceae bacterium]|nr:hypothetical protein [Planctomycetaceae bacterium]
MIKSALTVTTLALLSAMSVLAHENDPKADGFDPPYEGPGWREADGGLAGSFESEGIQLRSWLTLGELGGNSSAGNDCWGYVSPSGQEYALMCTNRGTAFVEVTDPGDPEILVFHNGPSSTWRDIKVYGEYAYAVSEGGNGIQCFDLRNIDSGSVPPPNEVTTGGTSSTHNVAINIDSGYLYRCGGGSNIGLRIYDLKSDPMNPTFVGEWLDRYVHDVQVVTYTEGPYAGMEVAFCCAGFNNGSTNTALDIVDVTDKANPALLRRLQYPNGAYSHQGWLTPDRKYFLLGDELDEGGDTPTSIIVINVENIYSPTFIESWTNDNTAITHNIYTLGDFAYMANYTSGMRVFDIRDPENMKEVGFFDTRTSDDSVSFDGLWSCYPYLPSGTILGSDIQRGLFVWTPDLARLTFELVDDVPRTITSTNQQIDFRIDSLVVPVDAGQVFASVDDGTGWNQISAEALGGGVHRVTLPSLECPASVQLRFSALNLEGELFESQVFESIVADDFPSIFSDDFESSQGWASSGSANSVPAGIWQRGTPFGTGVWGDPTSDFDGSGRCYLTGNGAGVLEVDGEAILTSPAFNAVGSETYISYASWFANDFGPWPKQDSMYIEISNDDGTNWDLIEQIGPDDSRSSGGWFLSTVRVADYVVPTEQIRIRFRVLDTLADSILEAAVDRVAIETVLCDVEVVIGDLNGDLLVNGADLAALLSIWGEIDSEFDLDGDGIIAGGDLSVLLSRWTS